MWPAAALSGWKASEPTFWEPGLFSSSGTTTRTGMVVLETLVRLPFSHMTWLLATENVAALSRRRSCGLCIS